MYVVDKLITIMTTARTSDRGIVIAFVRVRAFIHKCMPTWMEGRKVSSIELYNRPAPVYGKLNKVSVQSFILYSTTKLRGLTPPDPYNL